MSPPDTRPTLPAVVLGGYLGAGKTTLVNELLRQADGQRIAVLVNDFGDISIDADLIEGASGDVLALAGGCVCCSFGADLIGTLQRLLQRDPSPQRLLIECSGVGLPAAVARTVRLLPQIDVRGVVTVLDAADAMGRAGDRYVGDTVRQQIRDADRLVMNQTDRCDAARLDAMHAWLADLAPGIPVCEASHGRLPAEWLWEPATPGHRRLDRPARHGPIGPALAADRFRSETWHPEARIDPNELIARLTAPGAGVQRAKGWIVDTEGRAWLLQVAAGRALLTPDLRPAVSRQGPPQLLVIVARDAVGPRSQPIRP